MIVNSDTLVLSFDEANNPLIGWHDVVTLTSIEATTEADGFPASNLANPATHLIWKASGSNLDEYLTVTTNYTDEIDYLAVARHNFGTAGIITSVEGCTDLANSPQVWFELVGQFELGDNSAVLYRWDPQMLQGVRLRMQPGDDPAQAAVLYIGKLLVLERSIKIDVGHTPFNLGQVSKIVSGKSQNGNFLGRTVLSTKGMSTADFSWFNPDWYRENFEPFVEAAQTDAFFFAWNPEEYPLEIDYAWLREDPKAEVDPVTRRIAVKLEMEGLAGSGTVLGTVSPAALPAGAVGVWYMNRYTTDPRPLVPNSLASIDVSSDLFGAPRRLFNNATMWGGGAGTIADDAATAPDGSMEASTYSAGAVNWTLRNLGTGNLPAGTYTVAINAKRNTGSDQVFAFTKDSTSSRSSVKTATSAWQRFSYTFTQGSPFGVEDVRLCSSDGSTGTDIQICDFELYEGTEDLGPQVLDGHLYWGSHAADTRPSYSGGWVDMTNTGFGTIQLGSSLSIPEFTAIATCAQVDRSGPSLQGFLSKVQAFGDFTALLENAAVPDDKFAGSSVGYSSITTAGLWRLVLDEAHVFGFRYDGAEFNFWIDDIQLLRANWVVTGTQTLRDLWVGLVLSTSFPSHYKINSLALWDSALSDDDYRQAVSAFTAKAAESGIEVQTANDRIYLAEGDSLTASAGGTPYPSLFGPNASPPVLGVNFAVNGTGISDMTTRAAGYDSIIPPDTAGRKFILSVLATNGVTSGSYLTDLAAFCDARRAAGWLVIVCTITPRTTGGYNTDRNTANTTIRTWVGLHADAICDFAANGTIGPDAAASDTTYYSDGIHFTATAAAIAETVIRPVINAL